MRKLIKELHLVDLSIAYGMSESHIRFALQRLTDSFYQLKQGWRLLPASLVRQLILFNSPVSFQTVASDPLVKRVETVGKVQPHVRAKIVDSDGNIVPIGMSKPCIPVSSAHVLAFRRAW